LACLEVGDNPLDGALGSPNQRSDFAQRRGGVARDGQQDTSMVAEECPARPATVVFVHSHGLTRRGIPDKKDTIQFSLKPVTSRA
jgi:hypothetical protein